MLEMPGIPESTLAEARAMKGALAKSRWRLDWATASDKPAVALRSPHLQEALGEYVAAFEADLNIYHAGLGALWLATIVTELARAMPAVWEERFESEDEARFRLDKLEARRRALIAAVGLSLERQVARGHADVWTRAAFADHRLLAGGKPSFVAAEYRKVAAEPERFALSAIRSQLELSSQLGVLQSAVQAALAELPRDGDTPEVSGGKSTLAVLFAGHMLDAPDRASPRFRAGMEGAVRSALTDRLRQIADAYSGRHLVGVAGASAGGDILFHEVCGELGITSIVCLPVPAREYVASSVQYAGAEWVGRFQRLVGRLPTRELSRSSDLPRWLRDKPLYSTWERNLTWELYVALETGRPYTMLLALWDDTAPSARGGVEDFVNQAKARGMPVEILDLAQLRANSILS